MLAFRGFGGPQNGFGGVGKVAAGQIGRRVDFVPGDVVEDFVVQHLQSVADAVDIVGSPCDPKRTVRLQNAAALVQPEQVETVVADDTLRFVPAAFVHAHHAPTNTGNAAIGQEVRRVSENHLYGLVAHSAQQFQRIGLIQAQVTVRAGIKRRGRGGISRPGFVESVGRQIGGFGAIKQVRQKWRGGIGQGRIPLRVKAIRSYPITGREIKGKVRVI